MNKFKIKVKNNSKYATIALFLDQEKTIELIKELRKAISWGGPISPRDFDKYYASLEYKLSDEFVEQHGRAFDRYWGNQYITDDPDNMQAMKSRAPKVLGSKFLFEKHIDGFMKQYSLNINLRKSLIKTIISDEVHETDFQGAPISGRFINIKRNRALYWKNTYRVPKLSHSELAEQVSMEEDTVHRSIQRYRNRLEDYKNQYMNPS